MNEKIVQLLRNPAKLAAYLAKQPFKNPSLAQKTFLAFFQDALSRGDFVAIAPSLLPAIAESPDPDMALLNLDRFTSVIFSRTTFYGFLKSNPSLIDLLAKVFGSSQFLSDALVRNPEYLDWLADPVTLRSQKNADDFLKELRQTLHLFPKKESKMHVLRRFKRREMLRIGTRDLLGLAPLETTVCELSHLTDALVQTALDLAWDECVALYGRPMEEASEGGREACFCVVGMGKLGGRELNYSSDIDLMFVYSAEGALEPSKNRKVLTTNHEFFNKLGSLIIDHLAAKTKEGYVFRVDMRLRPEGETGPLTRSMESYENYYAQWGEAWEKLALVRARPIAGDKDLGSAFLSMVRPFVYQKYLGAAALQEIRHLKRRIESRLTREGTTFTEVKLGYGGIREIEFSVQLLQLMHGGRVASLQSPNTFQAMDALTGAKLLTPKENSELKNAYRFLRRVEHFLQIVHELQVHELPKDKPEQEKLARRIGYRPAGRIKALQLFQKDFQRHTHLVHRFHERIFGAGADVDKQQVEAEMLFQDKNPSQAKEILSQYGLRDAVKAQTVLHLLANGPSYMHLSPATVRQFISLTPRLLRLLRDCSDPDAALNQLEAIVRAQGPRNVLYRSLEQHEKLLELLVSVAANSAQLADTLVRHPEFLESLIQDPSLYAPKLPEDLQKDLESGFSIRGQEVEWDRAIKEFKEYETLRIGIRDILGLGDVQSTGRELSDLADVVFSAVWGNVANTLSGFAVLALGKWGSRELGYHSDLDVLFVYRGAPEESVQWDRLAQKLMHVLGEATSDGMLYKVDARLRPGGKNDVLVLSMDGYRDYYHTRVQSWEKQMLTRLRFVRGDENIGRDFMAMVDPLLFDKPLSRGPIEQMMGMRQRMILEKCQGLQRGMNVKLDEGGMVDVEFVAQFLQLHWGWKFSALRHLGTLPTLVLAEKSHLLKPSHAKALREGYLFLRRIENRLRLIAASPTDLIPLGPVDQLRLARSVGFTRADTFLKKYQQARKSIQRAYKAVFIPS